uniref:Beta/gamma crystallin 'Greek key' domain-containing protein n=1 Tax=Leptobrachium leishanense TaxID=445787 RepID=A0A8C5PQS9_9ANUR
MERKLLRKEVEKLLGDYVGVTLREKDFDPKGQKQSTLLDDLRHLPVEDVFEIYGSKHSAAHLQNSSKGHWTQAFNLSLHPFAMLTAPQAAEHAWKHCTRTLKSTSRSINSTAKDLKTKTAGSKHQETIIFYEDRNFQGRSYECSSDSSDLLSFFNRCGSVRVEHGNWMVYEFPNYRGCQFFLKTGEYPDFNQCTEFGDSIRSCRIIPQQGSCKIRVYEREDFRGQMMEFTEDCPQLYEKFRYRDIHSCNVLEGHWIFYDEPNYKGRQYYLRPGEYRKYNDWGGVNGRVGSIRRAVEFH